MCDINKTHVMKEIELSSVTKFVETCCTSLLIPLMGFPKHNASDCNPVPNHIIISHITFSDIDRYHFLMFLTFLITEKNSRNRKKVRKECYLKLIVASLRF